MSVESSLRTQAIASVSAIDSNHLIHGDFGEYRPDPAYPRILFTALEGHAVVRTWRGGARVERRLYRFWVIDKDAAGALSSADCVAMADELRAGLDDFADEAEGVCRVLYQQTFDLPEREDERIHVRVVDFDVFVSLG